MSGAGTGLKGVVLDETRIAFIDGDAGKLVYRGYNIHDLAVHATFEEVSYLLLYGALPNRGQLRDFDRQLKAGRTVPGPVIGLPCNFSSPESGRINPSSTLRNVLLPHPDGPTIDRNSPSRTSMSKFCSARTGPRFGGRNVRLTLRPWM